MYREFTFAAERFHISQPPLSQYLKTMEGGLGTKLVEKSGKFLEVTEAGKSLYKYALQITQLMEVEEIGNGVSGRLTIGINTFSLVGLPNLLQQFRKEYPKVTYKIHQNESSHLCRLLDLVVCNFGKAIVPEIVMKQYKSDNIQAFKITDTELSASTGLIWLKNHYLSKTALNFTNLLLKYHQ